VRLRSDRFTVWRARLAADFVFAIVTKNLRACTLANVWQLSTLKVLEARTHAATREVAHPCNA
jgi:hypothetical protein